MSPIEFTTAKLTVELEQILALQRDNLETALAVDEARSNGFVTLRHDLPLLIEMNRAAPQVIAKQAGQVVGYALVMLPVFAGRLPVLDPLFQLLGEVEYRGRPVSELNYFVMGQVCVAKACRGMGVFDGLYAKMRELYGHEYELVCTELATRNTRSARAHTRVGFKLARRYRDGGEQWDLIHWNWDPA